MTGQQFQQRRLQLGLSQAQLAEQFGIEIKVLQDWELGKTSLPYPKILYYAFLALEWECELDNDTLAEFARIRKLIDDGHERILKTFPSS
ncbi:MAG: helix-turn-helix domain-containing protein [Blastocatellia bacterium]